MRMRTTADRPRIRTMRSPAALFVAALTTVVLMGVPGSAWAQQRDWDRFSTPSPGPADSIGYYANGCLRGGMALPPEGEGYQVVRLSRNRFYAHPTMVTFLEDLGRRAAQAGLGRIMIADVAMPRGGPFRSGHASHQTGLDADVWLRLGVPLLPRPQREDLTSVVVVAPDGRDINPSVWTAEQAELIRLAASDPRVDRIFVHPAIKLALCRMQWPDRSFLRILRPWFGHDSHMHIRLHCPSDAAHCQPQEALPPGDGCGADLMAWFPPPGQQAGPPPRSPPRPPLPALCQAMLRAGD